MLKKFGRDALERGFVRDGLRAVFAKFRDVPFVGLTWPGAALAIEAALLIHLEQRLSRANQAHLLKTNRHRFLNGFKSCGRMAGFCELRAIKFNRGLCCGERRTIILHGSLGRKKRGLRFVKPMSARIDVHAAVAYETEERRPKLSCHINGQT